MSGRRKRLILAITFLVASAACRTSPVREPGEPVDLPLDNIDTAVPVDGGAVEVMQAEEPDGGAQVEGAGAGEPQDGLGIDLRDM